MKKQKWPNDVMADTEGRAKLRALAYKAAEVAGIERCKALRAVVVAEIERTTGEPPISESQIELDLSFHGGDEMYDMYLAKAKAFDFEPSDRPDWSGPILGETTTRTSEMVEASTKAYLILATPDEELDELAF